ncbi:MAG: serine/threonine-protein kinase [Myxococcales bacterium]|nr:serine/threonine-protein kinase [Myxococcales bacterium]
MPETPLNTARAWEPGTLIGQYQLLTPLAQGGMAEIWLARHSGLKGFERLVAVKRLLDALLDDPEQEEMFLTEARLAAQINHPHVVQISDLGEVGGSLYLVMEYLDGENLAAVRRAGQKAGVPVDDALAAKWIAQAAAGLHAAHTGVGLDGKPLNIVHRDISPQNVMVTFDGGLKVLDFGVAKVASQSTASGKLKGKFAYMSPEQVRGEPVDGRSDVFSLGIVLFEFVVRGRLLPNLDDVQTLTAISTGKIPPVRARRPDLDPALAEIVDTALAPSLERRYQSARELQEALEGWLQQTHASPDPVAYMKTLFARRITQRRELIDSALKTDLTPGAVHKLAKAVPPDSNVSAAPRRTPSKSARAPKPGGVPVLPLVLGLLALIGGAAFILFKPGASPEVVTAEPVDLAPLPVLVVESSPPGATIEVDGIVRGRAPVTFELPTGEHALAAVMEGHEAVRRTVKLPRRGERVVIEVALSPTPAPTPTTTPATNVTPPKPRPSGQGKLTLKTSPWTTVYLGKQKLGDTPLLALPLPAGRQVLRLVNPEANLDSTIEVDIVAGETTVTKLRL